MRSEELSVSYPDTKEDCDLLKCKKCGLLVDFIFEDKPFVCFRPAKSHKIVGAFI